MATFRLVDSVPVKQFTALIEQKLIESSPFRQSGVVGTDPQITAKAQNAGLDVSIRNWKRIVSGEATSQSDDPSQKLVPGKVSQGSLIARMLSRSLAFSAMDIADFASDADAIAYAVGELARLRLADEELVLFSELVGVMADNAANDAGDMQKALHFTTGTITDANKINVSTLLAGRRTMGDMGGDLKTLVMHSDVVNNLREKEPNAFVPTSKTDIGLYRYLNYNIIETDNIGKAGTGSFPIYTTYMCGDSLFAYASRPVEKTLVQVRDEFAGNGSGEETVINRFSYMLPILGFNNVQPPANGVSQTNAELSAATTWDRVEARKAIPLVKLTTNG